MLHIYYGDMNNTAYGPSWFNYSYDIAWFQDPYVQNLIQQIDGSQYVTGGVIESPVLGPIPPEKLSGGLKTLIMIYEMPDRIFDATSCGPNCAASLLEIGERKDVTINLRYFMPIPEDSDVHVEIMNVGKTVNSVEEFTLVSLDCLE